MKLEQIIGKNLSEEQKEAARAALDRRKEGFEQPLEGEYTKDEFDLRFIDTINWYIKKRFEELKIDRPSSSLTPRQFHLLSAESFAEHFPHRAARGANGFYDPRGDSVIINKDTPSRAGDRRDPRLRLYMTMMHEAIHAVSVKKFSVSGERLRQTKIGYQIGKPYDDRQLLVGLNEVITDIFARIFFQRYQKQIEKKFNLKYSEGNLWAGYAAYRDVWYLIANKISEKTGESVGEINSRYQRGLFTGEMMHLREIEEMFGKDALRVLAALGCREAGVEATQQLQDTKKIDDMVLHFFQSQDPNEKKELAGEILARSKQAKQMHEERPE